MATAQEEYVKARKLGTKEYNKALSEGHYPYLPALDHMLEKRTTLNEIPVGTFNIPISLIVGTVTTGRQDSFARNFMPLLDPATEFGTKWISLMEYQTEHGISDAIKVIEFLGKFYVLEGNKRVSVMRYLGQSTMLATVTRIMPPQADEDDKEVRIYNEFLKFFKCTNLYSLTFTEEGSYQKLATIAGKDLEEPWDEDSIMDLRSAFTAFSQVYLSTGGKAYSSITPGDAFLVYLDMYKYESLKIPVQDEIKKNLSLIWKEIRIRANGNQIVFSEEPQLQKKNAIPIIDNIMKKTYTEQNPLKVLFLYDGDATKSRWIHGHEEGRKDLEEVFPGVVKTLACDCKDTEEEFEEAVEAAAEDGADLIITTSPVQMEFALKAAVKYPKIKFLNCSVHLSHGAVRTYYGRMYEVKFLLGMIAATMSKDHRIGYVSTYPICGNIANINAFAIGASMVDPEVKIHLTWSCLKEEYWREYVRDNHFSIVSGPDLIKPKNADNEYGLYTIGEDGSITNIAFPLWNWGKYYELIVQTILNDAWDAEVADAKDSAINYWWGMTSGVIDIYQFDTVPYETLKLVSIMRKGLTSDVINPFEGELRSQTGVVQDALSPRLSNEQIINMNWLCDNVVGSIPSLDELTESARKTVLANGMPFMPAEKADKAEQTENGET